VYREVTVRRNSRSAECGLHGNCLSLYGNAGTPRHLTVAHSEFPRQVTVSFVHRQGVQPDSPAWLACHNQRGPGDCNEWCAHGARIFPCKALICRTLDGFLGQFAFGVAELLHHDLSTVFSKRNFVHEGPHQADATSTRVVIVKLVGIK
jgi:hypothetical protein